MGTDIHGVFQRKTAEGWEDIPSNYGQDRHYQLFAVLGGVRNGYGFAHCPTGEAVVPIAEGRGFPPDFEVDDDEDHPIKDPDVLNSWRRKYYKEGDGVWMGDHSHSWASGEEMLAWWKNAPTVLKTGVVGRDVFNAWDGTSRPEAYCGSVFGRDIITVSDDIEAAQYPNWTHRRVEWESPLAEELRYFFEEVQRLVQEHGEIRFVFGFDS